MKTKKLVLTALLTAFALVAFTVEAAIPPITPIYGIKLGIANVFTLFALYSLGTSCAAAVQFLRIILGSIFTGQAVSFIYSMTGGALAFLLMVLLKKFFPLKQMWALSALCAVMHNTGQLAAAVLMTGTVQILCYLPVLLISGIISGAFTGSCAQLVLMRLQKQDKF
ncbi:MAG: Gx transporter family protein [Oscillospiraceae bacterium]|nr:Gx transporter family protein [Oscillospiraceae bacterium]